MGTVRTTLGAVGLVTKHSCSNGVLPLHLLQGSQCVVHAAVATVIPVCSMSVHICSSIYVVCRMVYLMKRAKGRKDGRMEGWKGSVHA